MGKEDATEVACKYALHFYNTWKRDGFTLSARGHLSLLASAQALLDSGGWIGGSQNQGTLQWFENEEQALAAGFSGTRNSRSALDLALSIAQHVNDENRGNTLQVRAQKLISNVIDRPGVLVAPNILFEAAQGEYYGKNNHKALTSFKKVLASLDAQDDATRQEYGSKVMYFIGSCLDRLGRELEASMAFREGCTTWRGDPEYDPKNAKGYYDAIKVVMRKSSNHPIHETMFREAENLRLEMEREGADQSELQKRIADRDYDKKEYRAARERYLTITEGKVYEECIVKAALCLYKLKELDRAREEFRDYVERHVVDPANAITDPKALASRDKARAQATYYLGRIAFEYGEWDEALKWLAGFTKQFPSQTDYGKPALYMTIKAHLAKPDIAKAKAAHAEMLESFPADKLTGSAAYVVYDALKTEQEKAEKAGEAERSLGLKREMVDYVRIYNSLSTSPSFTSLRAESVLWIDLGEWTEAEGVLRGMQETFADDASVDQELTSFVLPDLGLCLLEQQRVPEAFDVLDPLVPDPDDDSDERKVSSTVVHRWCRAVCGWVEGDAVNIVEVPGVGGEDNLSDAATQYRRLVEAEAVERKWECEWYKLKFELSYAYLGWSQLDSDKLAEARQVLVDLRELAADPNFDAAADKCGGDVLQKRLQWLWRKVQ
jgi:tetratricopeptide (TPR) repeat protein